MRWLKLRIVSVLAGASCLLIPHPVVAAPLGTEFTYQGQLKKNGSSLTDTCNLKLGLYDALTSGVQIGSTQTVSGVSVNSGLFTVMLNGSSEFGATAFNGDARWLEIAVQCTGDPGFTTLTPRQEVTPAPMALFALMTASAESLALPFASTETASVPLLDLVQLGNAPAARFKVQPQPEPPMPRAAIEASSSITAPALKAENTGGGPALEAVRINVGPPEAPVIRATNSGVGSAIEAVSNNVGPPVAPTILATSNGDGPALEAVRNNVGPPEAPVIRATNSGVGSAIEAVSNNVGPPDAPTILATNTGGGSAASLVSTGFGGNPDTPALNLDNQGDGPAVKASSVNGIAGYFQNTNSNNSHSTLRVESNGGDYAFYAASTGSGHGVYVTAAQGTPGSFEITNPANNSPALQAESNSSGPAVYAPNTGSGPAVYASSTSGNALHDISTSGSAGYFEGNVHLTGNLTKAYTVGTSDLATPIAYAVIASGGTVTAGTPNVSSSYDLANNRYLITITGESYSTSNYVTTASPVAGAALPRFATTSAISGQLVIRVYDLGGNQVQNAFHFVTYKP